MMAENSHHPIFRAARKGDKIDESCGEHDCLLVKMLEALAERCQSLGCSLLLPIASEALSFVFPQSEFVQHRPHGRCARLLEAMDQLDCLWD